MSESDTFFILSAHWRASLVEIHITEEPETHKITGEHDSTDLHKAVVVFLVANLGGIW